MSLHSCNRQTSRLRGSGVGVYKIMALPLSFVLLLGGCRPQPQTEKSKPPRAQVSRPADSEIAKDIGSFVNPELFSQQTIRSDDSGKYVEIGDMRFRVNEFETFGYGGKRWANGSLNYDLAPEVRADANKRSQFEGACRLLTAKSGVTCFDNGTITSGGPVNGDSFVYVINDPENYSYVGQIGGRQLLGIHDWNNHFVIAHEIKHALGWEHEHSRPDRDLYIRINWDNIPLDKRAQFEISPTATTGFPYDFESIMHYAPYDFAMDKTKKTIEALPPYQNQEGKMGNRDHLSPTDLLEVIGWYGKKGTKWCGVLPKPDWDPPDGCFFMCVRGLNSRYGRWWMCGSCNGAEICP